MPPFSRIAARLFRNTQIRGGHDLWPNGNKFWSEGTQTGYDGFAFGEVPLPPGQKRVWEWWELPWYTCWGTFTIGLAYVMYSKPPDANSIRAWARPRAELELHEDMKMLDKLNTRPDLLKRLQDICVSINMIEEEAYDLVLMRNEYKILYNLFHGKIDNDLLQILDELRAE